MSKLILVGGGGHSKVILNIIKRDYPDFLIEGYVANYPSENHPLGIDLPYLGKDLNDSFDPSKYLLVMAIGQVDTGKERQKLIEALLAKGYRFLSLISKRSVIARGVKVGQGTVIFDNVVVNVDSVIGSFCILNTGCIVEHDCRIGDFVHIGPGVVLSGGVNIGNNCFLGAGSVVKHYTNICGEVIVGAGGVVVKNIDQSGVFVGVPVKKIK